jgi:uncharacterized membrane protein
MIPSPAEPPKTRRAPSATSHRPRLDAIDALRGLVMVIMALDHVRDFFTDPRVVPTDLWRASSALFLTRWITHFCAPVFVFLAGTGAYLYAAGGKTKSQLAFFLLTRGLWLVLLEITLVHLGWSFNFDYHLILLQVIWAIGASMVVLAGLSLLPTLGVTAIGIALIVLHNYFEDPGVDDSGPLHALAVILCRGGRLQPASGLQIIVAYPLLPWFGVMCAGYGCGALWLWEREQRQKWLLSLGSVVMAIFILLRAVNWYGDPSPWTSWWPPPSSLFTLFSFVNCTKYPPSLLFVLMTLGPALVGLALLDRGLDTLGRSLVVFGRVPLFYYLVHAPLIHLVALVFALTRYGNARFLFHNPLFAMPAGYGYGLLVVYLIWVGVVLMLYPLCRWFGEIKQRRKDWWLSYL